MKKKGLLLILFLGILLGGCQKEKNKVIYVTIQPAWGDHEKPKSLKVLLYEVGGEVLEYVLQEDEQEIQVKRGDYRVLMFNNDAKNISFMELSSFEKAYAAMVYTKGSIDAPGELFSYSDHILIETDEVQINARMKSLIVKANFEISISHSEGVANVESSMRNMPDAITLTGGAPFYTMPEQENIVLMSPAEVNGNVYKFSCVTFGTEQNESGTDVEAKVFVDIGITYKNGETKVVTADITEAITQASEEGGEVTVILGEIGLTAVVKSWIVKKGNAHIDDDK